MSAPIVLVIDADPAVHDGVAEALAEEEYVLLGARSEALALQLVARRPVSVAVIDARTVQTPPEMVRQLQQIVPNMRVLITVDRSDIGRAGHLAAVGPVLPKPLDLERLRLTVRSLARLAAMTDEVAQNHQDSGKVHAVWRRIATTRGWAKR